MILITAWHDDEMKCARGLTQTLGLLLITYSVFAVRPVFGAGEIKSDWAYAERRLTQNKFDQGFIRELKKTYESADFQNVTELNLLLFLRKTDDHGVQVTADAADKVRGFLEQNHDVFLATEKYYGVSAEVVASLLYIESRYGKNLGRFQLASVFVHLIQLDRRDLLQHFQTAGALRFTDRVSKIEKRKISERRATKVKWALGELRALESVYKEKGRIALEMRGSFAGAFGLSQFLPSSYAKWARSFQPGGPPNLAEPADAIASTAFYLKENGWRKKKATHLKALLNYNNSHDYANAILKLAELATKARSAN